MTDMLRDVAALLKPYLASPTAKIAAVAAEISRTL